MIRKLKMSLAFLFIGTFSTMLFGEEKTVILQNGLNDYSGCIDSYNEETGGIPMTDPRGSEVNVKIAE